jgi:energy-converting hydrogenase Eha subunit A
MLFFAQVGGYHYSEVTFWYVALGIGFVVILVVIALLTLLVRLVQDIDQGVVGVENVLARTSNNTSATFNIPLIAQGVDDILNEGLQHHLFLTRVMTGGGRKTLGGRDIGARR